MIVVKAFDKGLKCRGYQYHVGLNVCEDANCRRNGFHAAKEQARLVTDQIAANNEKNKAALEKAEKEIKRLKAAANLHAQRINFALEAINRAMSDIDNEIRAAESEAAGAGTRLKAQVEAMIGKMVDGRGWQV